MKTRILFSSSAQRDVSGAAKWYAEQGVPDLERRFQFELEKVLERVRASPLSFQVAHRDIRRANFRRFPYAVFYRQRGDHLLVLAVLHHARQPEVYIRRR